MADKWDSGPTFGIVTDKPPYELAPGQWSLAYNVSFRGGKTQGRYGLEEVLYTYSTTLHDLTPNNTGNGTVTGIAIGESAVAEVITLTCTGTSVDGGTFSVSGSVSGAIGTATVGVEFVSPYLTFTITDGAVDYIVGDNFTITLTLVQASGSPRYLMPWAYGGNNYWVWTTLTKAYKWDGLTHTDVTRTSGGDYAATNSIQWTGCTTGGVAYLNNGVDVPQYLGTSGTDFANFPTGGSDWPANLRCKSLRAFKSYLIAMSLSEGASSRPQSLRWSTAADPGSLPQWDITDPTLEAGETVLAGTDGDIVDGLPLGDSFIIYKTDSVWGMQLVGGQYVMQLYKIFEDDGALTQNCVTSFQGQHFVASATDVYIHNGSTKRSVIADKVKDILYQVFDREQAHRCYCVTDQRSRESLFCFVLSGSGATMPNIALVYNWDTDAVSVRDLPNAAYTAYGPVTAFQSTSNTWAADAATWDTDLSTWGDNGLEVSSQQLVFADATNNRFLADYSSAANDAGSNVISFAERSGIDAGDPQTIKYISRVYPRASGSSEISVYVGSHDTPSGTIIWDGPYAYTPGQSRKVDCRVSGRYIAIRFSGGGGGTGWGISGYSLEGFGLGDGAATQ